MVVVEVEVVGKRFEGVVVRKEVGKISVAEPRREGLARQAVTAMGVYQMVLLRTSTTTTAIAAQCALMVSSGPPS